MSNLYFAKLTKHNRDGDKVFYFVRDNPNKPENIYNNCQPNLSDICDKTERNLFYVSEDARRFWSGFDNTGEKNTTRTRTISGRTIIEGSYYEDKELVVAVDWCFNCPCQSKKLNEIFNDCCGNGNSTFEFQNDCGQIVKIEVDFEDFVKELDEGSNCGYLNINATEIRGTEILISKEVIEYDSFVSFLGKEKICSGCLTDCYEIEKWTNTKTVCQKTNNSTIIFVPQEAMSEITIVWNGVPAKITLDLVPEDRVEIRDGKLYVNGVFKFNMSVLGINMVGSITSNAIDCYSFRTPGKKGYYGTIEYEVVERCSNEVWGLSE